MGVRHSEHKCAAYGSCCVSVVGGGVSTCSLLTEVESRAMDGRLFSIKIGSLVDMKHCTHRRYLVLTS